MRIRGVAGALVLSAIANVLPAAHAQSGGFMWCAATAGNGADSVRYYSRVFNADASAANDKAVAFKSEVEDAEISAASVSARCMSAPTAQAAQSALAAATASAPGEKLDWAG